MEAWRLRWIRRIAVFGLVAALIATFPLWTGRGRVFPTAPLLPLVDVWLSRSGEWVYLTLLGILASVIFLERTRIPSFLSLALLLAFAAGDQMRWRAAMYVYAFMLLGEALGRFADETRQRKILSALRLAMIGIYCWAGLHKFNWVFLTAVFPWIIRPFVENPLLALVMGITVPFVEFGLGLGLLFARTRRYALVGVCAMHAFILVSIGPFANDWNSFVWPWNVAMASLSIVLFSKTGDLPASALLPGKGKPVLHFVVLLLFVLLPALHLAGRWDAYPSFSLYSGNTPFAELELGDRERRMFSSAVQELMARQNGAWKLDVQKWAEEELGAPPYPESRVYRLMFSKLCAAARGPDTTMRLLLFGRPNRVSGERTKEVLRCRESGRVTREHESATAS